MGPLSFHVCVGRFAFRNSKPGIILRSGVFEENMLPMLHMHVAMFAASRVSVCILYTFAAFRIFVIVSGLPLFCDCYFDVASGLPLGVLCVLVGPAEGFAVLAAALIANSRM